MTTFAFNGHRSLTISMSIEKKFLIVPQKDYSTGLLKSARLFDIYTSTLFLVQYKKYLFKIVIPDCSSWKPKTKVINEIISFQL